MTVDERSPFKFEFPDTFEMPKVRKTVQLRVREDVQPGEKESLILEVASHDSEGQVTLLWTHVRGPEVELGRVGVSAINLFIHPDHVDLAISLQRFVRGEGTKVVWMKGIKMEDSHGVQYLDVTMDGCWRYPPFPKGGLPLLRGGVEIEEKP